MTEQELAQIEARNAPDGGPFVWAPTADVYRLLAEVRRLRGLVEAAYREGAMAADPHGADDAVWEQSDARKALEGA